MQQFYPFALFILLLQLSNHFTFVAVTSVCCRNNCDLSQVRLSFHDREHQHCALLSDHCRNQGLHIPCLHFQDNFAISQSLFNNAITMFRRLSSSLPKDPEFPADLEKLG